MPVLAALFDKRSVGDFPKAINERERSEQESNVVNYVCDYNVLEQEFEECEDEEEDSTFKDKIVLLK